MKTLKFSSKSYTEQVATFVKENDIDTENEEVEVVFTYHTNDEDAKDIEKILNYLKEAIGLEDLELISTEDSE